MKRVLGTAFAVGVCLGLGCGDDDGGGGEGDAGATTGTIARFAVPESGPIPFEDVPFPSDLHIGDDGTVDLMDLPTDFGDEPIYLEVRRLLNERRGFCVTCNSYFHVEGELDPESVPARPAPDASASADDPVVLVDVDPDSPDRGSLIPVRVEWDVLWSRLAVRPVRGHILARERRYAAAITDRLLGADGAPLGATDQFLAVRDGTGGDAAVTRAREVVGPALDELESAGVDRSRIVAVAAFTTEDPTADVLAVKDAVDDAAVATVTIDRVYTDADGDLDRILGVPAEDRPGEGLAAVGAADETAVAHSNLEMLLLGTITTPRILTGTGDTGRPNRDADGVIRSSGTETVGFALSIPKGVEPSDMPVVVAVDSWNPALAATLGQTAGGVGIAVLAIEAFPAGSRAASAEDVRNEFRGIEEPDGFYEFSGLDVGQKRDGFIGVERGLEGLVDYSLGGFLQTASDTLATLRYLREGDVAPIQEAHADLGTLSFDADHLMLTCLADACISGIAALTVDGGVTAANVYFPPGGRVDTLAQSPRQRNLAELAAFPTLLIMETVDDVSRSAVMHALLDLYRWGFSTVDARALAPYLLRERIVDGTRPDLLFHLSEYTERISMVASVPMVSAVGAESSHDVSWYAAVDQIALPASGNVTVDGEGVTAVASVFEGAGNALFQPEGNSEYVPPYEPPFEKRDEPLVVTNPIQGLHDQMAEFWRSSVEDGQARVIAVER